MHRVKILVLIEALGDAERDHARARRMRAAAGLLSESGYAAQTLQYSGSGDIADALRGYFPDIVWSLSQYCRDSSTKRRNVHELLASGVSVL